MKRFIWSTPCDFALTFFALHQTVLSVTYKQYTVWYFHTKSWYSSKNRCMIFCTVCFKWNLSSLERLPVSRSIVWPFEFLPMMRKHRFYKSLSLFQAHHLSIRIAILNWNKRDIWSNNSDLRLLKVRTLNIKNKLAFARFSLISSHFFPFWGRHRWL